MSTEKDQTVAAGWKELGEQFGVVLPSETPVRVRGEDVEHPVGKSNFDRRTRQYEAEKELRQAAEETTERVQQQCEALQRSLDIVNASLLARESQCSKQQRELSHIAQELAHFKAMDIRRKRIDPGTLQSADVWEAGFRSGFNTAKLTYPGEHVEVVNAHSALRFKVENCGNADEPHLLGIKPPVPMKPITLEDASPSAPLTLEQRVAHLEAEHGIYNAKAKQ